MILSKETVVALRELGYKYKYFRKSKDFRWVYPDGTVHIDCPTTAVRIAIGQADRRSKL